MFSHLKLCIRVFRFYVTAEAIVVPIIMLGARWVVKNIKFTPNNSQTSNTFHSRIRFF